MEIVEKTGMPRTHPATPRPVRSASLTRRVSGRLCASSGVARPCRFEVSCMSWISVSSQGWLTGIPAGSVLSLTIALLKPTAENVESAVFPVRDGDQLVAAVDFQD